MRDEIGDLTNSHAEIRRNLEEVEQQLLRALSRKYPDLEEEKRETKPEKRTETKSSSLPRRMNSGSKSSQMYLWALEQGRPVTSAELAEVVGEKRDWVSNSMWTLVNRTHRFKRVGDGLYEAIPDGEASPKAEKKASVPEIPRQEVIIDLLSRSTVPLPMGSIIDVFPDGNRDSIRNAVLRLMKKGIVKREGGLYYFAEARPEETVSEYDHEQPTEEASA